MAKTYTVVKDGIELKELKTLPAAKKLADAEGAEVMCEGEVVYTPELTAPYIEAGTVADTEEDSENTTDAEDTPAPDHYTLTTRMNVRKEPDTSAPKLRIAEKGAVVEVISVENDWLCIADGSFILYGGGKYAVKI